MNVILSFVMSLDGFVVDSKGRGPAAWASAEDQKYFFALRKKCGVVIMGGTTYEAQRNMLTLDPKILRIVMTKHPKKYHSIPGQLEFMSKSPKTVLRELEKRGYKSTLLAAGPKLAHVFMRQKLVNELHLTVEPLLFGAGTPIGLGSISLTLVSARKINARGTMLLRFKVGL